jgi:hypothetical protein
MCCCTIERTLHAMPKQCDVFDIAQSIVVR